MNLATNPARYVLCIANDGCDDLQLRQVYRVVKDPRSERAGLLRVIDEAGEDYLYPKKLFARISVPSNERLQVKRLFEAASRVLNGKSKPPIRVDKRPAMPSTKTSKGL